MTNFFQRVVDAYHRGSYLADVFFLFIDNFGYCPFASILLLPYDDQTQVFIFLLIFVQFFVYSIITINYTVEKSLLSWNCNSKSFLSLFNLLLSN